MLFVAHDMVLKIDPTWDPALSLKSVDKSWVLQILLRIATALAALGSLFILGGSSAAPVDFH